VREDLRKIAPIRRSSSPRRGYADPHRDGAGQRGPDRLVEAHGPMSRNVVNLSGSRSSSRFFSSPCVRDRPLHSEGTGFQLAIRREHPRRSTIPSGQLQSTWRNNRRRQPRAPDCHHRRSVERLSHQAGGGRFRRVHAGSRRQGGLKTLAEPNMSSPMARWGISSWEGSSRSSSAHRPGQGPLPPSSNKSTASNSSSSRRSPRTGRSS